MSIGSLLGAGAVGYATAKYGKGLYKTIKKAKPKKRKKRK